MSTPTEEACHDVVILGAGMSGLCMAIALQSAGRHDFVIVEKSAGLGGTWWDNRYPGAQVDVPAPVYAFSFAPHARWRQRFATADEILGYMQDLATRHGLHKHLRLGTAITAAVFDEARGLWRLSLDNGAALQARAFVCSTGPLSVPRWPDIAGLEHFAGTRLHTARWDATVPLQGRRIGVIGTGSTAAQLVPEIAPQAAQLHVFQRTANWVLPRMDRRYGALDRALARLRPYQRAVRWTWAALSELLRRGFEDGSWMRGHVLRDAARHLKRQVADPALRARLLPPYPFGCKRIIFSNTWYRALARPNVELVTEPIVRITPEGIVTADGRERPLDVLVCATGFDVQHSVAVPVTGRAGQRLQDAWAEGPQAHLGTTVAGFPNLFLLLGPNTATGHTSTLLFIEPQVQFVIRSLAELQRRCRSWLDVKPAVMAAFNAEIEARLAPSVWMQCRSWYRADSGRNVAIWPGYTREFRRRVMRQDFADFEFG
jgi:cation diffusion facilitator CzcD-associated flavoprotein CzcO